jgi:CheY-like chemotaxis protein
MDGWALLRMVRARNSLAHIPFVFLTSLGDETERLRGYKMGVDDYITKPYDLDALAGRLDRLLARYEVHPRGAIETKTLCGDLDQVSLRSLLAYLEEEKKSGTVLPVRTSEQATLYLAEGRIVRSSVARPDLGEIDKVLYTLGWHEGRFEFEPADIDRGNEKGIGTAELLAEQKRRGGEALPPPGSRVGKTVTKSPGAV